MMSMGQVYSLRVEVLYQRRALIGFPSSEAKDWGGGGGGFDRIDYRLGRRDLGKTSNIMMGTVCFELVSEGPREEQDAPQINRQPL
jgi:hypothetical protein